MATVHFVKPDGTPLCDWKKLTISKKKLAEIEPNASGALKEGI